MHWIGIVYEAFEAQEKERSSLTDDKLLNLCSLNKNMYQKVSAVPASCTWLSYSNGISLPYSYHS